MPTAQLVPVRQNERQTSCQKLVGLLLNCRPKFRQFSVKLAFICFHFKRKKIHSISKENISQCEMRSNEFGDAFVDGFST